jgi:hypothetical protein
LKRSPFELFYSLHGRPTALPKTFSEVMADGSCAASRLMVGLSEDFTADCYFFTPEEIEFSLDPRQICGEHELGQLLAFITQIGLAVNKSVLLTLENCRENPILVFDPGQSSWTTFPRKI